MDSIEDLLEAALVAELGVLVKSPNTDALRRRLYVALRKAKDSGDLRFIHLTISSGVEKGELIIRKKFEV